MRFAKDDGTKWLAFPASPKTNATQNAKGLPRVALGVKDGSPVKGFAFALGKPFDFRRDFVHRSELMGTWTF